MTTQKLSNKKLAKLAKELMEIETMKRYGDYEQSPREVDIENILKEHGVMNDDGSFTVDAPKKINEVVELFC